jgi:ubiquinone/menaquinone biosynthesis C-methylase UbiE
MQQSERLKNVVIEEFSSSAALDQYKKEGAQGLWKSEEALIEKYFAPRSTVLDIGCGTGRTTLPLAKMNYRVVGVDLTPAFIEIARDFASQAHADIEYRVGDCTKLEFSDKTFDNALFSYNGWCQIPGEANRVKALREICRVLRTRSPSQTTGGYFIFSTQIRKWKNFKRRWMKQLFRIHILRRLGFRIDEIDFGDTFFQRSPKSVRKQFMHFPNVSHVVQLLNASGFELIEMRERLSFGEEKPHFADRYNCMMYVARKR